MTKSFNFFNRLFSGLLLLGVALASSEKSIAQGLPKEDQVKAAFLFNFAQFTEWPAQTFTSVSEPFVIGILADDPFGSFLNRIVEGEKIQNHPVIVKRYRSAAQISNCHLLFIQRSHGKHIQQILSELRGKDILTVSDAPYFTAKGGMIKLYVENNRMRFQINTDAAKSANLVMSSKLLRLADICCEQEKTEEDAIQR